MIERRNIIRLLSERTKPNVYHSAILTCYNFDPIFFESVYLPSLRSLGITNVIVLMDASMYDNLLSDPSYICHQVSPVNYTLVRQENSHHGVFHPKMALLFGEEEGVIIVGSGNLTFSGLSNNEEVWNAFHVVGNTSVNYPLLYKAWRYVQDFTENASSLVKKQLGWITEQSLWLQVESTDDIVVLANGEECSLLYNDDSQRILDKVTERLSGVEIEEITVIAPFYDTEGNALNELKKRFSPSVINCVFDLDRQSAPYSLLKENTGINFFKHSASNPLHAKIIEFKADNGTWLLSGSANARNMALGMSSTVFNDEACVLLHSTEAKNYIHELGVQYTELKEEERLAIERPKQPHSEPSKLLTTLKSCEEKEGKIHLHFSKSGIKGTATILDKSQSVVYEEEIITDENVILSIDDSLIAKCHIALLVADNDIISNRCLVIKELNVESCNPDPKRRRLSSLLDDSGLLQNLTHILGYIEFDEDDKKQKKVRIAAKPANHADKDDVIVTQDRFDELKDSTLSISMHSGVRILSYLQQILFKKDEQEKSDDDLLEIDKDENGDDDGGDIRYDAKKTEVSSAAEEANRMRSEVLFFLKKMQQHFMELTADSSIHGDANKLVYRPRLLAIPGLNAGSAIAVASRAVIVMMNKYGNNVQKRGEIRELLIKCAGLFFSLYGYNIPDDESNRSKKTRELIKDASVDLLTALSFFELPKDDTTLPPVILNCLDIWKDSEELQSIVPLYVDQLSKLNQESVCPKTVNRILRIAEIFLSGEAPICEFSIYDDTVYVYRKYYGFLVADHFKKTSIGLSYDFHGSWFDDNLNSDAKKYKGYKNL